MPIFVEWKWEEKPKSLLAIFHFYDNFLKPNLRLMDYNKAREPRFFFKGRITEAEREWVSWAPSHTDMALLMQMLCYANIINGLKPSEKRELWAELEGKRAFRNEGFSEFELANITVPDEIKKQIGLDRKVMAYGDPKNEDVVFTCVELCSRYIDYLRKLLKRYVK